MDNKISDVFRMAGDLVQGPWNAEKRERMLRTAPTEPLPTWPTAPIVPLVPKPTKQG